MSKDETEPPTPKPTAKSPPRRPTTIDLTATEIKTEPAPEAPQPEETAQPEAPPAAEAQDQPPPESPRPPSGSVAPGFPWPMVAAAAVAAVLFFAVGLGAGRWLLQPQPQPLQAASSVPAANDALSARVAKVEAALAVPRAADPQLLARIAAAEAAVKTATELAAARDRRADEIATIAREARERAVAAGSAAEAAQKAGAAPGASRGEIEALANRIAALEQAARASQAELSRQAAEPADDVKSRLAVAGLALRNAVENGDPFSAQLAAVKAMAADAKAVAALEPFAAGGVPTAQALGRELSALMPAIWKAARGAEMREGSFLERLQANAERIVRVRPAGEVAGDEPDHVRARIEARAASADVNGALAELAKLPPAARAPAEAWIRKAQARNAALAAARAVSDGALSALAKPGS